MRSLCGRLKIKYIVIAGLTLILACYLLLLRERASISLAREPETLAPHVKNEVSNALGNNLEARNLKVLSVSDKFDLGKIVEEIEIGSNEESEENKDKKGGSVSVYVVEEHHEVLPYWYKAATSGIIPKTGNTLIHFDGHSDMAPPVYVHGYPFFKWPSPSQVKYLLQSNDAFIQAAVIAGLINRLIWVWPKWDVENHEEQYLKVPVSVGWFYAENEADDQSFCMCATLNQTYICRSMTDFGLGNDDNGFDMPTSQCRIKRTLLFEEVSEAYALEYFREKFSLDDSGHVLLDIDEDYYGCTYAVMPLLNANVSLKSVKRINKRASALFCPKTTKQDQNTDKLLFIVIDLLRQYKQCSTDKKLQHLDSCKNLTDQYIRSYFASELIRKNETSFINMCKLTFTTLPRLINSILQVLNKLSYRQLETLQLVGFCSSTSPKTYLNEDGFTICMGANTPASTAVLIHSPTVTENRKRSKTLQSILNSIPNFLPKVVTVARSVRDGYTPKEYFEDIEKDVLSILKGRFNNDVSIHYDKDLLGGVNGWPARRRALVKELEENVLH